VTKHRFRCHLLDKADLCLHSDLLIHNKFVNRTVKTGDIPLEFLTYQLDDRVLSYRGIDE
jgi:hypothetical protein